MPADRIPTAIIGLLSQLLPERYTHAGIDSLFQMAGAPEDIPEGSKPTKVQAWLRHTNRVSPEPLKVLGVIIDDFMEMQITEGSFWTPAGTESLVERFENEKAKIRETLAKDGLTFSRGGLISKGGSIPTLSLDESVKKHGLSSVDDEIKRALAMIETDPHAAAQYAGNVLEASLKAYLDHKSVAYKSSYALADLWKISAAEMGLRAADLDNDDLKKIVSGLHSIVSGVAHLRNAKSAAHGKSEEQRKGITLKPRHARLAIHAAHTVAAYVLELIE